LVWLGSIVLCLALVLVFTVRFRAVGIVPAANGFYLISLTGFRGEAGREKLEFLVLALGGREGGV
jgi:hypothetical protein